MKTNRQNSSAAVPALVTEYRVKFRKDRYAKIYSGHVHFVFSIGVALAGIAYALSQLQRVTWQELLVVPAMFTYSNVVEYVAHRGPMHHRIKGLILAFNRHTVEHHHFFTHRSMSIEGHRDFKIVLFPAFLIVGFIGLLAAPLALLVYHFVSPNAGYLTAAAALVYFVNYECFHLIYHLRENSWVTRLPLVRKLRSQHTRHHDPAHMSRSNFNITWPLCDWLFGTYR